MDDSKKMAAAMAAVMTYIKTEEEALAQAQMGLPAAPAGFEGPAFSAWSANGRQTQMQMRSLMQMRTFRGNTMN